MVILKNIPPLAAMVHKNGHNYEEHCNQKKGQGMTLQQAYATLGTTLLLAGQNFSHFSSLVVS
jgi:hypothetical protein